MEGTNHDPLLGETEEAMNEKPAADSHTSQSDVAIRNAELALNLRNNAAAGWLFWVTNSTLGQQMGPDAFLVFRNLMVEEAGNPTDPVERMLIEQLALAHFSIGQLRIRSCSTNVAKLAIAYADSATRLLGEFRRCSLALEEYRSKRAARKDRTASEVVTEATLQTVSNTGPQPSANGKENHSVAGVLNNGNKELPAWVKKRMSYPTPNGSQPAGATAVNGDH